jgi:hypothetical protein
MRLFDIFFMISIILLFFGVYAYMDYRNTINHEEVHKQVAVNHGCVDYNISIRFNERSNFKCFEYSERPEEEEMQERYLHSVNEIVSYNLVFIAEILFYGFLFVIFSIFFVRAYGE